MHCHTIASSHAYSTVKEYAETASQKGLTAIAITDHAPGVTDGAHLYHFQNLSVIPSQIEGVNILSGAECTLQDAKGRLDLENSLLERLDIVIASMHQTQYAPKTEKEHTSVLLNVMENPCVHIMGHIGRERMEFDIEQVVKKAKETKKLIEINSSSLKYSKLIKKRCLEVVRICKKYDMPIVLNSDSHICYDVGNVDLSVKLISDVGYNEDLVMNTTFEKISEYLNIGG